MLLNNCYDTCDNNTISGNVSIESENNVVVKKAMMDKSDIFLPNLPCRMRKPLHQEKTNKSIKEEINKLALKEQQEMSSVVEYCKSDETYLVNELNQLSMKEREIALYDIHGVADYTDESAEVINEAMHDMDKEIGIYLERNITKSAYSLAESQSQEYVQDRTRRLLFLRAEQMNASQAAQRFVEFFEQKLSLFGPDKLCTEITLTDFSATDMEFLTQGSFQLLPTRDRAGRAVFAHMPVFMKCKEHENMLRSIFYLLMSALDDEETQKKGIVFVFLRYGPFRPVPNAELTQKSLNLFNGLPIRIAGWHCCTDDKLFFLLFPLVGHRFEKQARVRLRVHHGSYVECSYTLMTFGIPVTDLPITDDLRGLKKQKHQKWISTRRYVELKRKNNNGEMEGGSITLLPSHSDILFGRGKPVQEHPGNLSLGLIVESLLPQYGQCNGKKQKMALTQGVVQEIKSRGGRFIQQVDGVWEEVDDEMARSKVSHTFRNKKQEQIQGSTGQKRPRTTQQF